MIEIMIHLNGEMTKWEEAIRDSVGMEHRVARDEAESRLIKWVET